MKKETAKSITKINVKGTEIIIFQRENDDFISLTDIAKSKNLEDPRFVIQNWMKTKFTVDFLGIWEHIHNPNFNRVEFDTVKNEAGSNAFVLTPQKWIAKTNAANAVADGEDEALLEDFFRGYPGVEARQDVSKFL